MRRLPGEAFQDEKIDLNSSQSFHFPTLPVHGAAEGHRAQPVTDRVIMAMHRDDSSNDDTTSSLGDSYDLVDDRSIITTDEEDLDRMTASITSSDGYEVERPLTEDSAAHSSPRRRTTQDEASEPLETPTFPQPYKDHARVDGMQQDRGINSTDPIVFEEPSVINLKLPRSIEVSHTVKIIDPQEAPKLFHLESLLSSSLALLKVRQTMAHKHIDMTDRVFKILYDGPPEYKDQIMQKIGSALAALPDSEEAEAKSDKPTKFNVVPISSFGDTKNPEVVLIGSSGIELIIDECSGATSRPGKDGKHMSLLVRDGRHAESRTSALQYIFSGNYDLPDLAICFVSKQRKAYQDTGLKSFMDRHQVKTLVISDEAFILPGLSLDSTTPHLWLDWGYPDFQTRSALQAMPIDLSTFSRIDAGQMNRALAFMKGDRRDEIQASQQKKAIPLPTMQWRDISTKASKIWETFEIDHLIPAVSTFLLCLGLYLGVMVLLLAQRKGFFGFSTWDCLSKVSDPALEHPCYQNAPVLKSEPIVAAPQSIGQAIGVSKTMTPKSQSTSTDVAAFLLDAYASQATRSEQFQVNVLGDCHVILRPPYRLLKSKKTSGLEFQISRGRAALELTVSTLFDGVYALQVPREEAYGLLNLTVKTKANPSVNERFEVDFGSSWLKIAAWKRATRAITSTLQRDLSHVQSNLQVVYNSTKTELSTFVASSKWMVTNQTFASRFQMTNSLQWSQAKAIVLAQTKEVSRVLATRMHRGRNETSKQLVALSRDLQAISRELQVISTDLCVVSSEITQSLAIPMREGARSASQGIRHLAKATAKSVPLDWDRNLRILKQHFRNTQKSALKTWWKVKGVPERKAKFSRSHGGRERRRERAGHGGAANDA